MLGKSWRFLSWLVTCRHLAISPSRYYDAVFILVTPDIDGNWRLPITRKRFFRSAFLQLSGIPEYLMKKTNKSRPSGHMEIVKTNSKSNSLHPTHTRERYDKTLRQSRPLNKFTLKTLFLPRFSRLLCPLRKNSGNLDQKEDLHPNGPDCAE